MNKRTDQADTRSRFIAAATSLFADKGFYGASMDQIAGELSLTKQALIHHFGSKEKLYGAVLSGLSEGLKAELAVQGRSDPDEADEAFTEALLRIHRRSLKHPDETRLLLRELLDNRRRASQAGSWYLRPFLDGLQQLLARKPAWRNADPKLMATHIFQLLGAIVYFAVSTETLKAMYSAAHVAAMRKAFPGQLRRLAEALP